MAFANITYFSPRKFDILDLNEVIYRDSEIIQFNQTLFDDEDFRCFCVMVKKVAMKVTTLRFYGVVFTKNMSRYLLDLLKAMPQIVNLHVSHPKESCHQLLINTVDPVYGTSIRCLENTDQWTVEEAYALLKTLRFNRKLHFLNVELPALGDVMLREVTNMIKTNRTLCTVHLSPDEDQSSLILRALCKELRTNALLHGYDLADSDLFATFNRGVDGSYYCFTGTTSHFSIK